LITIAIARFIFFRLTHGTNPDRVVKFSVLPPGSTHFAAFDTAVISPDARSIAVTATDDSGESQLWERPLAAVEPHRLDRTEGAQFPFWSPDSRTIAFFANGKLQRIEAAGGAPNTICDAASGRGGSWNRAGTILFAPSPESALFQVPATGGRANPVTNLNKSTSELSHRWPSFLPDDRHFVYSIHKSQPEKSGVYAGVLDSKLSTLLLRGESNATYVNKQGTGYLVFTRGNNLLTQPLDSQKLILSGEPQPIAQYVAHSQ
jgi:Tol biopolymer transport system component